MKLISLRLDEKIVDRIDEIGRKTLMSRSEVIRNAIAMYISLLENIGFYFKPSLPVKNVDVYTERNAVYVDMGNLTSIASMAVTYAGVGEKELDERESLEVVAEVMASQLFVEATCRFVEPLAVMILTGNELDYSVRFQHAFRKAFEKRVKAKKILLASVEEVFSSNYSFFAANLIGLRDMSVRNEPQRGDSIFLWGKLMKAKIIIENLPDPDELRRLANLVRVGEVSAIFPIKSGGVRDAANFAASLAGGRAEVTVDGSCPASAVILCSNSDLSKYGCVKVGEII
ncbi:ribbon-helix-helix domain-containing protein [Archaeoglobus neptunius]|uniref:ribbon-helix-helix domain-containing protein n=1 Tax=Archaeoglobus neptunius TaxID=2798580 RepID=UPI0019293487|nr:ribbon-helix-helix domain-containing protein [Archaeoglobus neptunius]